MIRIVTRKRFGTRKTVEGSTLTSLRDGIQDLRYDDNSLTLHAIDEEGVVTMVFMIEVIPDAKDGVEFKIFAQGGVQIG